MQRRPLPGMPRSAALPMRYAIGSEYSPGVRMALTGSNLSYLVGVHGFKGSGFKVQGSILVSGLHLGCVFARKTSASSDLIQNLEPNWHLFEKMSIFI